jgi:hypothetical protein
MASLSPDDDDDLDEALSLWDGEYDLRNEMKPFPIFKTTTVQDSEEPIIGLVRTDLDSIGCHGSSLGAVVHAISVGDSIWQLNSSTFHFKTNEKSRLYVKTDEDGGWNPPGHGEKEETDPSKPSTQLELRETQDYTRHRDVSYSLFVGRRSSENHNVHSQTMCCGECSF